MAGLYQIGIPESIYQLIQQPHIANGNVLGSFEVHIMYANLRGEI